MCKDGKRRPVDGSTSANLANLSQAEAFHAQFASETVARDCEETVRQNFLASQGAGPFNSQGMSDMYRAMQQQVQSEVQNQLQVQAMGQGLQSLQQQQQAMPALQIEEIPAGVQPGNIFPTKASQKRPLPQSGDQGSAQRVRFEQDDAQEQHNRAMAAIQAKAMHYSSINQQ